MWNSILLLNYSKAACFVVSPDELELNISISGRNDLTFSIDYIWGEAAASKIFCKIIFAPTFLSF